MSDLIYWIWLSRATTPGTEVFRKLMDTFGAPEAVFNATKDEISDCIGSKAKDLAALSDKELSDAERILNFCTNKKIGILTYGDDAFPKALRDIPNPPVLLYYRGVLPDFNNQCMVSMVGTRRLSDYGRRNAFNIGYDLAKTGIIIVSGMATGIDGVSHAGSLSAGGINVAFLGSGIDVCYPPQHKRLAREIVKNGCVMTEYAPGTAPEKFNFPRRNRLIAGISAATVAIEGGVRSGALITAKYAKEFGKRLYALPGNVDNKTSHVSNSLIKSGAKLITSADDIVNELQYVYLGLVNPYNITERPEVKMQDVLRELEVSCVSAGDSIFSPFKNRKTRKSAEPVEVATVDEPAGRNPSLSEMNFDKDTFRIYKKIPTDTDCTIDSLVDDNDNMAAVMKALLKLEMGRFVTMLPGEKVKRNLN